MTRLAWRQRISVSFAPAGVFAISYSEAIMKVALIGASGDGGSRLLAELSRRGHQVTAIARKPETIAKLPGVTAKKGDVFDKPGLVQLLKGHDAVISAVHFTASDPKLLIEAVKESGVKRYFVVGGAGSLEVAPGVKLIDTPQPTTKAAIFPGKITPSPRSMNSRSRPTSASGSRSDTEAPRGRA